MSNRTKMRKGQETFIDPHTGRIRTIAGIRPKTKKQRLADKIAAEAEMAGYDRRNEIDKKRERIGKLTSAIRKQMRRKQNAHLIGANCAAGEKMRRAL